MSSPSEVGCAWSVKVLTGAKVAGADGAMMGEPRPVLGKTRTDDTEGTLKAGAGIDICHI